MHSHVVGNFAIYHLFLDTSVSSSSIVSANTSSSSTSSSITSTSSSSPKNSIGNCDSSIQQGQNQDAPSWGWRGGGGANHRGQHTILPNFPKNCMKLIRQCSRRYSTVFLLQLYLDNWNCPAADSRACGDG